MLNANFCDDDDILARRNSLIGQANNFLCQFSKVGISTKNMLFTIYCSSHYGSELWDLTNRKIEEYCIAWRKSLRKIWKLPYDCSCLNVAVVSNTVPIFDELCRRFMNFIYLCRHSDSNLVRSVVLHGTLAGMQSYIGRNIVYCANRYNLPINSIGDNVLNKFNCLKLCNHNVDTELLAAADCLREMLLVRDGCLTLSNEQFSDCDIDTLIHLLGL